MPHIKIKQNKIKTILLALFFVLAPFTPITGSQDGRTRSAEQTQFKGKKMPLTKQRSPEQWAALIEQVKQRSAKRKRERRIKAKKQRDALIEAAMREPPRITSAASEKAEMAERDSPQRSLCRLKASSVVGSREHYFRVAAHNSETNPPQLQWSMPKTQRNYKLPITPFSGNSYNRLGLSKAGLLPTCRPHSRNPNMDQHRSSMSGSPIHANWPQRR